MFTSISQNNFNNFNKSKIVGREKVTFKKGLSKPSFGGNKLSTLAKNRKITGKMPLVGVIASALLGLYNAIYGKCKFDKNLGSWYSQDIKDKMSDDINKYNKISNLSFNLGGVKDYDSNSKNIWISSQKGKNNNCTLIVFDKKTGEMLYFEKTNKTKGNIKENRIVTSVPTDYKITDTFNDNCNLYGNITMQTDLEGNFVGATEFSQSNIDGEFDVYDYSPAGKCHKIGLAEFDNNQGKHVEKHLVSVEGTVTDYVYADDNSGNRYLYYKITDAQGQVLYQKNEKFKVIDENHFISTTDGVSYDIKFSDNNVVVTKLDNQGNNTKEKVVYDIKEYSKEDYMKQQKTIKNSMGMGLTIKPLMEEYKKNNLMEEHTIDKNLLTMLKQLSGEEWFKLKNAGVECMRQGGCNANNAWALGGAVEIGENHAKLLSVMEHELGHEKFKTLLKDNNFIKIYKEEKALCQKYLPSIELQQMDYFLSHNSDLEAYWETLAEINQLIHIPNSNKSLGSRGLYLMKNFPKTIAYVANKDKIINQE